jgi:hypothetical protein
MTELRDFCFNPRSLLGKRVVEIAPPRLLNSTDKDDVMWHVSIRIFL